MLTCPFCQTDNSNQVTQCVTCGSSLGSDVLPNGTLLFGNTLEIQSVLGRGGFGIVYKALHLEKQKFVAIKELFPEGLASRGYNKQVSSSSQSEMKAAIDRTNREAQMLRKLKHPSATKLFAYWEENSTAYMALELLEGETLEKRIQNGQLLTAEEAKQALLTILEVLEELHGHGFLHRDIKPANIMFTPNKVELIDFGSLTEFRKGQRTKVTSRIATPEYAPLEQFGSEVTLSPATDLYALAATFCEAMTGSRVPSALDRANGASLEQSMLAVRRISRELADILEKALELRMDLRFGEAKKISSLLVAIRTSRASQQVIPQTSRTGLNTEDLTIAMFFVISVGLIWMIWGVFSALNQNGQVSQIQPKPNLTIPSTPLITKEKIASFYQTYGEIVNLQTYEDSSTILIYTYQNNTFNLVKFDHTLNNFKSMSQIKNENTKGFWRSNSRFSRNPNIFFTNDSILVLHLNGVLEYFNKNFEFEKKIFLDLQLASYTISEDKNFLFLVDYQKHKEIYSDTKIYQFDLKKQILSVLVEKSYNYIESLSVINNELLALYTDILPPVRLDAEIYNYSEKKFIKSVLVKEGIGISNFYSVKNGNNLFIYGKILGKEPQGLLVSVKYTKNQTFQLMWRKKIIGFVGCNLALSTDKKNLIFPIRSKGIEIRDWETGELKKEILLPDLYPPYSTSPCPLSIDKNNAIFVSLSSNGFFRIQNGI